MPTYVYSCPSCIRIEVVQSFTDEPLEVCPACGSKIKRKVQAVAIEFRGSGFYVNDKGE